MGESVFRLSMPLYPVLHVENPILHASLSTLSMV